MITVDLENIYVCGNNDEPEKEEYFCIFPESPTHFSFKDSVLVIPSKYTKETKASLEIRCENNK